MLIWSWEPLDAIWEARELPPGSSDALAPDATLIALPAGRALLLAGRGVSVNGLPALPLCSLSHLDEVRAGGRTFVVSAESRHEAAPLPPHRAGAACARCKAPIDAGELAVVCCACDSPHHPECFTDDPCCGGCPGSTSGVTWIPEGRP
jgi:hypothetical protein